MVSIFLTVSREVLAFRAQRLASCKASLWTNKGASLIKANLWSNRSLCTGHVHFVHVSLNDYMWRWS